MSAEKRLFGHTADGEAVDLCTLRAGALKAEIITYGAAIRALQVPGRDGRAVDVVLGYDSVAGYEVNEGYLGALVGRYANRIAGASCLIDGQRTALEANEGPNQLHGGKKGFSYRVFTPLEAEENRLCLTYTAADGEGGFPGRLTLTVTYTLTEEGLTLRYRAASDQATFCNITNHSYFNLNGGGDVLGHLLWLNARRFTPVDEQSIPTAMAADVAGTAFDFTAEKPIGRDIRSGERQLLLTRGYDHNFVLDTAGGLGLAARLTGEESGITMEVWTEKPGLQVYTANYLHTTDHAKGGTGYQRRQAVCLETQFFPDSPNHPEWGDILLRPGQVYDYTTVYRFSRP